MESKKICVVFGAGGFIGGQMCLRLKNDGHNVIGVDIKKHDFLDMDKLIDHFILADLRDINAVRSVIPNDVDMLFQFAADMGGMLYLGSGLYDADVMSDNILMNVNTAKVAVEKKVKKLFYSSSACVYPEYNQMDPQNPKCPEHSVYPAEPDTEYGWEKLFSERLYKSFGRQYNLNVRIGRFHNIFGDYGTYDGGKEKAPAALCRKIAKVDEKNDTIDLVGDGKQTRSFLYVSDCIDAILLLMDSDHTEPINIGSDKMIAIKDLALLIAEISGKKININHIDGPQGVRGRNSDNTIIRKVLNWEPKLTLKQGLEKTYEWIHQELSK